MRVPVYDNLQTSVSSPGPATTATPSGPQASEIGARQNARLNDAAGGYASAQNQIAAAMQEEVNSTRVDDATNQYVRGLTAARVEAMQLKSKAALERPDGKSLPDEYGEKLKSLSDEISKGLGNDAQRRAFSMNAGHLDNQFQGALTEHMVQQQGVYRQETRAATRETATSNGILLWGDDKELEKSTAAIAASVLAEAKEQGLDPGKDKAILDTMFQKAISPMHAGVMQSMVTAGRADKALDYYTANSERMTPAVRAHMLPLIQERVDGQKGDVIADAAWRSIGPQGANDPVLISDMDNIARRALKDEPSALKHALAGIRERATAFNGQQAEMNTAAKNAVVGMLVANQPMSDVQRSAPWGALPATEQNSILRDQEARAEHRANYQAALESRDYTKAQRLRAEQEYRGTLARYAFQDPRVLAGMKREEVVALALGPMGQENAGRVLATYDSIVKTPEKLRSASIDHDQFNTIAKSVGLDAYSPKSDDEKASISLARDRVNDGIDAWQRAHGNAEMPRDEKEKLMRGMAATAVLTKGRVWGTNEASLLTVKEEDAKRVVVPESQRPLVVDSIRRERGDPNYTPTDLEVGAKYLRKLKRDAATPR
jgi:hypothetical protein